MNFIDTVLEWLQLHGWRLLAIIIGAWLFKKVVGLVINGFLKKKLNVKEREASARFNTLTGVIHSALVFLVSVIALLMILEEFGLDTRSILAGLGLVGLAVSMAARDIMADFLSGLFVLLEGQYLVGDWIKVGAVEGEVEQITLRRTIVRDSRGLVHSLPNGQIRDLAKKV